MSLIEIPVGRIRVQSLDDKGPNGETKLTPKEMWGVAKMRGLWLAFKVWPGVNSDWRFPHVPQNPLEFMPSFNTEPLTEDDQVYMLRGSCVEEKNIMSAMESGTIPHLFTHILEERREDYKEFDRFYAEDEVFRGIYIQRGAEACLERIEQLKKLNTPI